LKPLESSIERSLVAMARSLGCLTYKLHERGAPDRLFITPKNQAFFVEFKRPGAKPRPEQEYEHARLRARGLAVYVVDSRAAGLDIIRGELFGHARD
jgi:hypothetical protein